MSHHIAEVDADVARRVASSFIRNAWYVAAWAHEVDTSGLFSRKILGTSILLYRKEDGGVVAMRDRCSHRFAPLSLGRREGDCVRCMYHGLKFDADGQCVEEPGRRGASPGNVIPRYPAVERWNQIWLWMGDVEQADPSLIPDCHFQTDPGWASLPGYMHYRADYRLILDNLMDFSHLTFVHEATLGGSTKIAATKPKLERMPGGVRLSRWYLGEPEIAPYLRGLERFEGPVDRWHIYDLAIAGNVFNMDSGSAPANSGAREGHCAPDAMQFHATQIITPEDERNSHFFWSYAHNFSIDDADLTQSLADRLTQGFDEDRLMIEAQQRMIDEGGEEGMAFILADNALSLVRRQLQDLLAADSPS